MLVNIDIRGDGGSRMCSTSRMSVYFTDTGTSIKGLGCALMAFASDARTRAHWPRVLRARAAMHMGGFYSPRPWPTKGGQGRRMKARIGSKGRRKGLCEAGGEGGRGVECPGRTRGGRGGGEGDKGKGGKGGRGLNALAEQRDGGRGFLGPGREGGGQGGRGKVGTRERMEGGRRGGMGPYRVLFLFAAADAL
jgi:hypothetical protein